MYDNILNAVGSDYRLRLDNMRAADELTAKGVSVTDLMKRMDGMEERIRRMEAPKDDAGFKAMESAVADDADVISARKEMDEARERALDELCRGNKDYADACERYRDTVRRRHGERTD